MPRVTLSREGRRELEHELRRLEAERPMTTDRIRRAREQGNDPTQNLDPRHAVGNLMLTESRIRELNALVAAAEPLEARRGPEAGAQLGTTVTVWLPDGDEAAYVLVSPAKTASGPQRLAVIHIS